MSVPISDFTAAGPYCIWSVVSNPPSILSTVEQRISSDSVRIIHWKRKKDDLPGVVQRCRRSEPDSDGGRSTAMDPWYAFQFRGAVHRSSDVRRTDVLHFQDMI